jgi:hypothetical protein
VDPRCRCFFSACALKFFRFRATYPPYVVGYDDLALQLQGARAAARASVPPRGKVSLAQAGAVQHMVTVVRRANAANKRSSSQQRMRDQGDRGSVEEDEADSLLEPPALAASLTALVNLSVNPQLQVGVALSQRYFAVETPLN